MLIYWPVRVLDRTSKTLSDRYLYVRTELLPLAVKAAIEFTVDDAKTGSGRKILPFRRYFIEGDQEAIQAAMEDSQECKSIFVIDYLEDEACEEIPSRDLGFVLTGRRDALVAPSGANQHDVEFMLGDPRPLPIGNVSLSDEDARCLAYFCRDAGELTASAFMKEGPGVIRSHGTAGCSKPNYPKLETAVTDEEIRSFVTVFRRLYMAREPANFSNAVAVFVSAIGDHRYGKWVKGVAGEYEKLLGTPPHFVSFVPEGTCSFPTKRLLDVFLYTQFAHQPDEKRQRQYDECLSALNGKRDLLTFMFLFQLWTAAIHILNAGRVISRWFGKYREHHASSLEIIKSLCEDHPGLGMLEKRDVWRNRTLREKTLELAEAMWRDAGCPVGGPCNYEVKAAEVLNSALERGST